MKRGITTSVRATEVHYDEDVDSLEISTKGKTYHSVNFQDFALIDLGIKNKIVGVEFFGMSTFYNIPKQVLRSISRARIIQEIRRGGKATYILVKFVSKINNQPVYNEIAAPPLILNN